MEWRYIGLVFFALLETLSAQEGYNYPAPTRPLSRGPERPAGLGRPGRPDTQPGQGITSFPDTGYSTGISRPVQQLPGSQGTNGYPERGRPSGQEFPSIPQGKKNGFSRVPGNKQREQGFSDQRETTQGYPSQNYPSSSASDQTYPGTSDPTGTTQSYPSRPVGSQTYTNQDSYSGSQNYPGQQTGSTEEGYPKQQGGIQGYPNKQRGSSRGEQRTGQGYSGQQEGSQGYSGAQGNSQGFPSKQASSQRYPSQQNNQNYPSDLSADRGYSDQPGTPASYNEQQRGPQRPQGQENRGQIGTPDYRGQQQGTGNIPEQGQFPESGVFPEQQKDEGDYSAIPGEPDRDYPILSEIPQTSFSCDQQQYPGYYADVETRCQVFHICANNKTYDFLCPNGTIFHQEYFVCVWWNQFNCDSAPSLYELNANIYDYSINGGQGLPSVIGETGGVGYPEESQTFGPQQPGGYPNRLQEQGYSPNQLPNGYPSERPADTKPVRPSGPRRPSSSFQQEYPSGSQESSTEYSGGIIPGEQVVGGGYQNGIQDQPGRSPNESVENQRPQFPKNRPFNQKPSVGANGYPSLEPGFPSTTPTETSSQEGGNGYSNGRPGTSFPGSRPQGPTQGYLPPFP